MAVIVVIWIKNPASAQCGKKVACGRKVTYTFTHEIEG